MKSDNPHDVNLARQRALEIYNQWRESLTYEPQTYGSISTSLQAAILRIKEEVMHPLVRMMTVRNLEVMVIKLSEFTPADSADIDDFAPDTCTDASLETMERCGHCGRQIAEYEQKFPYTIVEFKGPRETIQCVDCHIK